VARTSTHHGGSDFTDVFVSQQPNKLAKVSTGGDTETPYEVARRMHAAGSSPAEVISALVAKGLAEDEARIAARAGRGEAGLAPAEQLLQPSPALARPPELATEPPALAPAHPCPRHPAWPVSGTCTRCGSFFCHRCLTEAGLMRPPESGLCADCEKRGDSRAPAGIGGWLVLPTLQIVFAPVGYVVTVVRELTAATDSPILLGPILVESIWFLALTIFAVYTAICFFQKRKRTIPLMLAFYTSGVLSAVLGAILHAWLVSLIGKPFEDDSAVGLVRGVVALVVWGLYFLRSERVARTFVSP
jgi:hypothetical protein